jgi:hypothetical protein
MEQRPLRLGDILDDYCPRERRVTNHAIVAMIEDAVKQTRCTTCDAEHAYKGGKAPRRRKKEAHAALYKEVLTRMPEADGVQVTPPPIPAPPIPDPDPVFEPVPAADLSAVNQPAPVADDIESSEPAPAIAEPEKGPVHRPLIRATLPRPEGQKDARPLPEFTVRQAGTRPNGNFRGDSRQKPRGGQRSDSNRAQAGPRFAGSRPTHGRGVQSRGKGAGFRPSQQRRGDKRRSR